MMETTKVNLIEQIKEEICSRYGLEPNQVSIDLTVRGVKEPLALEILNDYAGSTPYYNPKNNSGHVVLPKGGFDWVTVLGPQKEGEDDES